jgi:hypothetical protein
MNTLVELRNAAVGVRMVERGLAAVCGKKDRARDEYVENRSRQGTRPHSDSVRFLGRRGCSTGVREVTFIRARGR